MLKISKGGITLSGGEPMVQREFVMQIFRRCKELGLHTCLDTSGRLGDRLTDEELMDIDLNLLDIKSGDPAIYEKVTRQPLQPTLDYARRLSALGRPMWVRFVLVPGLTDGYDNVERVADICAGLQVARARGNPALPPAGPGQVAQARPRLSAGRRRAAGCRADRARARPVPQPGADRLLMRGRGMEFVRTLLEQQPLMALFLTIAIGYLVGEINIKGFSLGVGAVLFVALAIGWFAPKSVPAPMVGTLGLALFLYAVGIQYGKQFFLGLTSASGRRGQPDRAARRAAGGRR